MPTATKTTRYAIVGTGGRATMFVDPICRDYKDETSLVALCDVNQGRLDYYQNRLASEFDYEKIPTYLADDFDKMVKETKPDVMIVCTVDALHHQYVIRAMELGCDVITEKPMTTDNKKCNAIFDAIKKTGKSVRVTFNYRWGPGPTEVYKQLRSGVIGDILHVDMEYLLNTDHGADYFRRWHRDKKNSGGLMVHKSTHHFDLVNWWLDAVPQTVFGFGRLAFYGRENAEKRGMEVKYDRYLNQDIQKDPFALDLNSDENLINLYRDTEKYDGYQRDQNVFGDGITTEDSMSVLVKYRTGTTLNYSLNAYLPREGFNIAFNGTKGRLEYQECHPSHIITGKGDKEMSLDANWKNQLIVQPMFQKSYEVEIPKAKGGHGGGDPKIQAQMFSPNPPKELYSRNAGHEQGAASILIGIAANQCFQTGQPVQIDELCPHLPSHQHLHDFI